MLRNVISALSAAVLLWAHAPAFAATITYQFTGQNDGSQLIGGIALPNELANYTTFSGTLEIDGSVLDTQVNPESGLYLGAALSIYASYDTGFSISGSDGEIAEIRINEFGSSSWHAQQFSPHSTDLASSLQLVAVNFSLIDHDSPAQNLFSDPNALVSTLPDPSQLTLRRLEIIFSDGVGGTAYVRGQLLELSAVPEPASLALFAIGAVATASWHVRRSRHVAR